MDLHSTSIVVFIMWTSIPHFLRIVVLCVRAHCYIVNKYKRQPFVHALHRTKIQICKIIVVKLRTSIKAKVANKVTNHTTPQVPINKITELTKSIRDTDSFCFLFF